MIRNITPLYLKCILHDRMIRVQVCYLVAVARVKLSLPRWERLASRSSLFTPITIGHGARWASETVWMLQKMWNLWSCWNSNSECPVRSSTDWVIFPCWAFPCIAVPRPCGNRCRNYEDKYCISLRSWYWKQNVPPKQWYHSLHNQRTEWTPIANHCGSLKSAFYSLLNGLMSPTP